MEIRDITFQWGPLREHSKAKIYDGHDKYFKATKKEIIIGFWPHCFWKIVSEAKGLNCHTGECLWSNRPSSPSSLSALYPPGCSSSPTILSGSFRSLSTTVTLLPSRARTAAIAEPKTPAPTITTSGSRSPGEPDAEAPSEAEEPVSTLFLVLRP